MGDIVLSDVDKVYENGFHAVHKLSLDVADGEFLVLVGPSGCGKSTALRMIAGLEDPTSGTITIGERVVNDVEAKDRDIAMVFQSYALYPHMTVRRNIEFPLRSRKVPTSERASLVQRLDLGAHLHPKLGVEVGQRLVEQEHPRMADDRPAQGDALALAAGKLTRLALEQFVDAEDLGGLLHAPGDLRLVELPHL